MIVLAPITRPCALQGVLAVGYGEALPSQCPPDDATDEALDPVYRLVPQQQPDLSCFASHNALGKAKPPTVKASDCQWASCSLNRTVDALLKIKGLRKRNRFVAQLSIPNGSGLCLEDDKSGHVDFWRFDHFDVSKAVQDVWEHGL
jgi:hypothetical protein